MKSLYNKNWEYTKDAALLDKQAYTYNKELFETFLDLGYSPREISHIIKQSVSELELETMIDGEE